MPYKNINFKALLFDLDGTLIDSMPLHNQAWIETLAQHGCAITAQTLTQYTGVPNLKTVDIFNKKFGWNLDPQLITDQKEASFSAKLKEVESIEIVVRAAHENYQKVPMAVVTGSSKAVALELLQNLGLTKYFQAIITSDDTQKHKPDPEPFLLAAQRLNIAASDCLVFEDGALGIQAAIAAGMKVIRVFWDPQGNEFKLELQ